MCPRAVGNKRGEPEERRSAIVIRPPRRKQAARGWSQGRVQAPRDLENSSSLGSRGRVHLGEDNLPRCGRPLQLRHHGLLRPCLGAGAQRWGLGGHGNQGREGGSVSADGDRNGNDFLSILGGSSNGRRGKKGEKEARTICLFLRSGFDRRSPVVLSIMQ